jgi:protoporphyrinogen IX oxidase
VQGSANDRKLEQDSNAVIEQRFQSPLLRASVAIIITALLFALLVLWNPANFVLWLKAFHVIAVIAWMAGMLYLPRLFVYHCKAEIGSRQSETFKVMERRLLRAIINPAMVATWSLGLWLAWSEGTFRAPWLHAKLALVVVMSAMHGLFSRWVRDFAADRNTHSQKFYRLMNEIPTLLMIGIVILVIVKPFS